MDGTRYIRIHPIDDLLTGYCECCGAWISVNDPEQSSCPMRYLSNHSQDWRNLVRATIKICRPNEIEDLIKIHRQLLKTSSKAVTVNSN